MLDCIWLLHSDFAGHPQAGGKAFHGVLWTLRSPFTVPDQMHDGGQFRQSDCLVAISQVLIYDYKRISVSGLTLEGDEQTTSGGTLFSEVVKALALFGIASHIAAGSPPPGGTIGNPAWKGVIPPSLDGPYRAGSAGQIIVIDSQPDAQPVPKGDDEMRVRGPFFWAAKNEQHWFQIDAGGGLWHKWLGFAGPNAGKQGNQQIAGSYNGAAGLDYTYVNGQLHLTVEDSAGKLHNLFQGDAEAVWHDNPLS